MNPLYQERYRKLSALFGLCCLILLACAGTARAALFTHVATPATFRSPGLPHVTYLDAPELNGHPDRILCVSQVYGASGVYNNHAIGVWYDNTAAKWTIFNQDRAAMPANAAFQVFATTPGSRAFVHTATAANTGSSFTYLAPAFHDLDGKILFVTPCYNGVYLTHPIYVAPDGDIAYSLRTQDGTPMPREAAFHVIVRDPEPERVFAYTASGHTVGNVASLPYTDRSQRPDSLIFTTAINAANPAETGTWYTGTVWSVFNQNLQAMTPNFRCNVWITRPIQLTLSVDTGFDLSGIDLAHLPPFLIELRSPDGVEDCVVIAPLGPDGKIILSGHPGGANRMLIKGSKALRHIIKGWNGWYEDCHVALIARLQYGDANGDNAIDALDLADLITAFNTTPGDQTYNPNADFNADDSVDALDLALLITHFNTEGD